MAIQSEYLANDTQSTHWISCPASLMVFLTATTSRQTRTCAHTDPRWRTHTGSITTNGAWVWAHRRPSVSFIQSFWVMSPVSCPDAVAAKLSPLVTTLHCHYVQRILIVFLLPCLFVGFCFNAAKIKFLTHGQYHNMSLPLPLKA